MLEIKNLTKRYKEVVANKNINLRIPAASVTLLVGPNGAGKSTLLKSIMGLLRYEGEILIAGHHNKSPEGRALLGYVPEVPQLYPLLTVGEHLELIARIYKLEEWKREAAQLLKRFDLEDKSKKLGSELSKGMQQKLSICMALLHQPELILFDEPMVGLDPHAIKELKLVFRELSEAGRSLLISTHILDSVDELWDVAFVMKDGYLVAGESRKTLEGQGVSLETFFFRVTEGGQAIGAEAEAEAVPEAVKAESPETVKAVAPDGTERG